MDGPERIERLRAILEEGPPLRLALLFGSGARGSLRPGSDLDIAIVPAAPDLSLRAELDLQARLSMAAQREVDLVRIDRASTLLRWRVAREGVPLVANPPLELPRFRARAAIEHADMLPQLRHAEALVRRRLAQGGTPSSPAEADG